MTAKKQIRRNERAEKGACERELEERRGSVASATERDERECTEWEAIEKDNNAETNRVSEE
jgi:hypothetical protein